VGLAGRREEENRESEKAIGKMAKECACGARIVKSEGCDHMTCECPRSLTCVMRVGWLLTYVRFTM
jgi:hypothetical protein